jgi:hypothetical protein
MADYPAKSSLRYNIQQDGSCLVAGLEGVQIVGVDVVPESGPVRDWLAELGIPKDWGAIEAMAQPRGLTARRIRFIVCDESPTRFPGNPRLQPSHIIIPHDQRLLTLGHLSYNVGILEWLNHGIPQACLSDVDFMRALNPSSDLFLAPDEGPEPEGRFILGQARLFDSELADKAWQGIEWKIFTHVCGVLLRIPATSPYQQIAEVAIIDGPGAGCPGARILKHWEA